MALIQSSFACHTGQHCMQATLIMACCKHLCTLGSRTRANEVFINQGTSLTFLVTSHLLFLACLHHELAHTCVQLHFTAPMHLHAYRPQKCVASSPAAHSLLHVLQPIVTADAMPQHSSASSYHLGQFCHCDCTWDPDFDLEHPPNSQAPMFWLYWGSIRACYWLQRHDEWLYTSLQFMYPASRVFGHWPFIDTVNSGARDIRAARLIA